LSDFCYHQQAQLRGRYITRVGKGCE
jgi:hypothetical protein